MRSLPLVAALLIPLTAAAQARQAPPPGFDDYVAKVMRQFEVPGMGIAIVKDGQVVLAKGYGVKRLGSPDKVDADTRFGIASNTKAFTALAIGMLVEQGKLEWDAPVVNYLPQFMMWDSWVTRQITVRDLLVHRSGLGLGAGDLLWWPPSTYTPQEIMRRLRYIEPATSFRSAYAYDNVLYLVAGQLIEAVSGKSWSDFVTERIIRPVGMKEATTTHASAGETGGNVAATHARVDGKVVVVKPFDDPNTDPAGGINAGAADMARWMIAQLDSGRVGDTRLWKASTTRQQWTLVTPVAFGNPPPDLAPLRQNFNGYALGFFVRDYRGVKLVTHTGGLPGYVSLLMMLPDQKLGVVVLTNQESGAAFQSIGLHVLDYYLKAPAFDWLGGYAARVARFDSIIAAQQKEAVASRDTASRPSLPLAGYAATYEDPWYGPITVALEGNGLVMRFDHTPALVGDLEHWQYETFLVRWRDRELRADAYVTFTLDESGKVASASMKPASDEVDFSFDFQDLHLTPVRKQ
ncbi:MAG TPA: serine hydrolase [Gemmatimonadales bacterium]|nr:serine hydrolase [Gemmatimonadales bacterium]